MGAPDLVAASFPPSPLRPAGPPPPKPKASPPSISVLDGIDELLAESLLRTEETPAGDLRFRMLETLRAYAIERLVEHGGESGARAAHVAYFTRWSEETGIALREQDRPASLDRFEMEHANLQAALGWTLSGGSPAAGLALAARCWKFWQYRAHFTEGRAWLSRLLEATPGEPDEDRGMAFEAAGVLAWHQGDLTEAEALLEQSLTIALARDDDVARARSLNNLGNVRNLKGDLDGAAAHFTESLELARALGDTRHEATSLNNLALIEMDRGHLEASQALLEESLAIKQRLGARAEMAIIFSNLALIAWLRRDLDRAIDLLEEALAIQREEGDTSLTADALGNLAEVLFEAGQVPRAVTLHRECLLIRHDIGDWLSMPYSLASIATAGIGAGLGAPAVQLLAASEAQREATNAPMPETDRAKYEETLTQARNALGEEAFAAAWLAGSRLGREEAVEAALALCDALSGSQSPDASAAVASGVESAAVTSRSRS